MDTVELGDLAKDKITGTQGIVICISRWLYGCLRITLQPQETKDGKPLDFSTFDRDQVEVVKKGVIVGTGQQEQQPAAVAVPGGPRPEPARTQDPR